MTALERPSPLVELLAQRLYLPLAPGLSSSKVSDPPSGLRPWRRVDIRRRQGRGQLAGTLYPSAEPARGAVLLVHPWHAHGQGYFYRRGRIPALRDAGFHVLTFDLGGFGRSGPRPSSFFDHDIGDALAALRRLAPGLPVHLWGVSGGGYWAHPLLSSRRLVAGAFFEDVAFHLLEWSRRMSPRKRAFYWLFEHGLPPAYRFLDLRRHAARLLVDAVAYVSGAEDPGVLPEETQQLAVAAGGRCLVVEGAGHLESIRHAGEAITDLALKTFAEAERRLFRRAS